MSDNSTKPDALSPETPVRPTEVYLVQGKKENRAFRSAFALLQSQTNYRPPSVRDEQEEVAQYHVPEKAGQHASQH